MTTLLFDPNCIMIGTFKDGKFKFYGSMLCVPNKMLVLKNLVIKDIGPVAQPDRAQDF